MTTTRTVATPALSDHDASWLAVTFARNRARFGFDAFRMEDTGGDSGGDDAATQAAAAEKAKADEAAAAAAAAAAGGGDAPKKLDLTQADLDKIISDRLGAEKKKFDQQLKDLQDSAGKSALEKAEAERDRYKEQAEGAPKTYGPKLAATEAKVAAMVAQGRPDRLTQIVKQADLEGCVNDDGEVDEAKVKTAIEKVLTDFPEWKATAGASGNDLGAGGDGKQKPTFTVKQIEEMSDAERTKRLDELNLAAAEGRISG